MSDLPSKAEERSEPRLKRLGPYEIVRRLGAGGMAEVYEAMLIGPHGFSKRVALKRILPIVAKDPAFVSMFIDEAKLAARLQHPNLVHVFDFGEDKGELYLAMELVDGTNVGEILRAVAARGEAVPLELALNIAAQAARGLGYAHRACDDNGDHLCIVHRDVSPSNLLVTQTGHIKLADFGIARAVIRKNQTQAGTLRGKLGYMSPEQVLNRPLDHRSDVFSLSIVLTEMLLGETLFSRGSDLDILMRIRDVDLGVLERTPRVIPADVRKLLLSALSRSPDGRPDANTFADVLEAIIRRHGFRSSSPEAVAKLLVSYKLVADNAVERNAFKTSATPSALVDIAAGASSAKRIEVESSRPGFNLAKQAAYLAILPDGQRTGPVPFPELVRLTTTGIIDSDTPVAKNQDRYLLASEYPELSRYFSTPALQWRKDEIACPLLRGELHAAILLPLVHSLAVNRETGMLYLESGLRRKKIYFLDGRPDFIASTDREEMLGEFLVNTGSCLPMEMDMALAVLPRYAGRLGDALVNLRVLNPLELYRQMAAQVRNRYLEAFRWRDGQWLYVRDARSQEQTYPVGNDSYVLMRDATMELDPSELDAALAPMWEKVLHPSSLPPASLSAYQVPDQWRWVLEQARGDATVGVIFARTTAQAGIDAEEALRALFLGISCQLVQTAQ
jgi:serine/threonine protein kinase